MRIFELLSCNDLPGVAKHTREFLTPSPRDDSAHELDQRMAIIKIHGSFPRNRKSGSAYMEPQGQPVMARQPGHLLQTAPEALMEVLFRQLEFIFREML